jgi:hypothetical protein
VSQLEVKVPTEYAKVFLDRIFDVLPPELETLARLGGAEELFAVDVYNHATWDLKLRFPGRWEVDLGTVTIDWALLHTVAEQLGLIVLLEDTKEGRRCFTWSRSYREPRWSS